MRCRMIPRTPASARGFTRQMMLSAVWSSRRTGGAEEEGDNTRLRWSTRRRPGSPCPASPAPRPRRRQPLDLADDLTAHGGAEYKPGNRDGDDEDGRKREKGVVGDSRAQMGNVVLPPPGERNFRTCQTSPCAMSQYGAARAVPSSAMSLDPHRVGVHRIPDADEGQLTAVARLLDAAKGERGSEATITLMKTIPASSSATNRESARRRRWSRHWRRVNGVSLARRMASSRSRHGKSSRSRTEDLVVIRGVVGSDVGEYRGRVVMPRPARRFRR